MLFNGGSFSASPHDTNDSVGSRHAVQRRLIQRLPTPYLSVRAVFMVRLCVCMSRICMSDRGPFALVHCVICAYGYGFGVILFRSSCNQLDRDFER